MTKEEGRRMSELKQALDIAADMFSADGYVTETGNSSPQAIKRFLLRKAREELYGAPRKRKAPGAVTRAQSHEV